MTKIHLLILLAITSSVVYAQGSSTVEPIKDELGIGYNYNLAPPDVANFNKINFTNVNLSTGKPLISIPIYTIKEGNIEYPITLSYDAGGVKVAQQASSVGLGWNITNTFISRNVVGGNDFNDYGHRNVTNANVLLNEIRAYESGYAKVGYFTKNSQNLLLNSSLPTNTRIYKMDFFPDIYNVNSPIFNTSFYFKDVSTPIELNSDGSLITTQKTEFSSYNLYLNESSPNSPFYDFNKINIVSNKGIEFTFNDYSVNQNLSRNNSGAPVTSVIPNSKILPEISAWYISEMKDRSSKDRKLSFRYINFQTDAIGGVSSSFTEEQKKAIEAGVVTNFSFTNPTLYKDYSSQCVYKPLYSGSPPFNSNGTYNRAFSEKVVSEISFSSGSVSFYYNQRREDAYNKSALTDVIVKDLNGKTIKHLKFSYSYFNAENCFNNSFNCKRLKLVSITENDIRTYKFNYNELINLPGRNSSAVDFLGYYNQSKTYKDLDLYESRPTPNLYFYPDQKEFSLLPFKFENKVHFPLPGEFDRTSNNYTFANILTDITYPEGAKETFEYELNEFNIFGNTVKGGGARIQKQTLFEGNTIAQQKSYEYHNSGYINNFPSFGFPRVKLHEVSFNSDTQDPNYGKFTSHFNGYPNWEANNYMYSFNVVDKNNINADLLTGSYVSYEKVKENLLGNGYSLYEFTSSKNYPNQIKFDENGDRYVKTENSVNNEACLTNFLVLNGGMGNTIYTDNSDLRGKLKKISVFDQSNNLLKKTENFYQTYVNSTNKYRAPIYNHYQTKGGDSPYIQITGGIEKDYTSKFPAIVSTIETNYSGNDSVRYIKDFSYNKRHLLTSEYSRNLNGQEIITSIRYPDNMVQNDLHNARELFERNILHIPISKTTIDMSEDEVLNQEDYTFNEEYGSAKLHMIYNSKETNSSLNISPNNLVVSYNEYDSFGNLLQYTKKDGIPVSLIWGYNNQYPIAKIEGVSYYQISNDFINELKNLSNLDNDRCIGINSDCAESKLRKRLNEFRSNSLFSNSFVTVYTHDPLIGVTSIMLPNGQTEYYNYDKLGRLINVLNDSGEVLKTMEYNYKK
ncbi:MAG TPA: hypothetical protein DEQ26_01685 [Flavobacteriaceae bacterium]|nr:hypothetical protein [Flavobacteriaceae bacterium]